MMNSVLAIIYMVAVTQLISCSGFKSDSPGVPPVDPGGVQTTPTVPSVTPTPTIVPTPTPAPTATPPGGPIYCYFFDGRFSTHQQIIAYAESRGDFNSCIRVNDQMIRGGAGPCIPCVEDGWTPTPTPSTPTPTATPWPSATPTPTPGGGGGAGPG